MNETQLNSDQIRRTLTREELHTTVIPGTEFMADGSSSL